MVGFNSVQDSVQFKPVGFNLVQYNVQSSVQQKPVGFKDLKINLEKTGSSVCFQEMRLI